MHEFRCDFQYDVIGKHLFDFFLIKFDWWYKY